MPEIKDVILDLFKHDLAACEVYKEVLEHIQDENIREQIKNFLDDNERHVEELSDAFEGLTGVKPERIRDLKGVVLSAYAFIRSTTGEVGALKALQTTENIVLQRYQEAAKEDLGREIFKLINQNLSDEERHGAYLNHVVETLSFLH